MVALLDVMWVALMVAWSVVSLVDEMDASWVDVLVVVKVVV